MTLELALRLSEILLGFAIFQQSLELLRSAGFEKNLAIVRALLSVMLMVGLLPAVLLTGLLFTSLAMVWRYRGPYNGGSDTMTILVTLCLWLAYLGPSRFWEELALSYLAFQLCMSYFQSGWVKLVHPEWRSGKALREVFAFTAYPVSEAVRGFADKPVVLLRASWVVIIGELLFPLALIHSAALAIALLITLAFHCANGILFGLNRFVWSWLAAYPIILWFQQRLVELL